MDVETKGEFITHLIKEVENADLTDIENVVTFAKWLDDELSYLVSHTFFLVFIFPHSPRVVFKFCLKR